MKEPQDKNKNISDESTTELLHSLEGASPEMLSQYIADHAAPIPNPTFFQEYLIQKNIPVATIVKRCMGYMSKSYIHSIINGEKKNPSRDIVLLLCLAAEMNKKTTRRALANYGHRDLYLKDTKDIIIATYINNEIFDIATINDELSKYGLSLLNE